MKASLTSFYPAKESDSLPCELVIRRGELVVSYEDDERGPVIYSGPQVSDGTWLLRSAEVRGRATLHHSPMTKGTFEGSWIEEGYHGMWWIELDDPDELSPEEESRDDLAENAPIRRLVARGKRNGAVTLDDVLEAFQHWDLDEGRIQDIVDLLSALNIEIKD